MQRDKLKECGDLLGFGRHFIGLVDQWQTAADLMEPHIEQFIYILARKIQEVAKGEEGKE